MIPRLLVLCMAWTLSSCSPFNHGYDVYKRSSTDEIVCDQQQSDMVKQLVSSIHPDAYSSLSPAHTHINYDERYETTHDHVITDKQDCNAEKLPMQGNNAIQRSACGIHYVLNYNPKRIPAVITEARCTCDKPFKGLNMTANIECLPHIISMRVLKSKDNCKTFKPEVETIQVSCITAYSFTATGNRVAQEKVVVDAPV